MSGNFYYIGPGGSGGSPWGWLIMTVIMIGIGLLLLPIFGGIVLVLIAVAVAAFVFRKLFQFFSGLSEKENGGQATYEEEHRFSEEPFDSAQSAHDPQLEVKDAVIVEEIERKSKSDV